MKDNIHRVTLELKERVLRGEKLKAKYATLSTKGQSILDDEPKSQAYFLIKAAQEREEHQRYGDDLDAKIRKAEKEVLEQLEAGSGRYSPSACFISLSDGLFCILFKHFQSQSQLLVLEK